MKYDLIIGNPPYGEGTPLYAKFFEKALEMADVVHMILPYDAENNGSRTKAHTERVLRHMIQEPENVSHYFPNVGLRNKIHYVAASRHQINKVPEYVDPLDDMPVMYPKRERLSWMIGTLGKYIGYESARGPEVLWSVQRNDLVTKRITRELFDKINRHNMPKWRVLINNMPSGGKFNCEIVNGDRPMSVKMFAVPANSKAEALRLKDWLTSDVITAEVKAMLEAKDIYTVSRKMLDRLPTYE